MPPRVLTVARWYPSHDSPGSGSFVADLVAATTEAGAEHVVASFETVRATPHVPRRDERRAGTVEAWARVAEPSAVLSRPRSRGARGVPVARLPVVPIPGDNGADALIRAYTDALMPFADRLFRSWRPDVIHAHTGLPDGVAAAALGRRVGIPVVVSEHASTIDEVLADERARQRYLRLLDPGVRLVAVSPALRSRLGTALGRADAPIAILPNPVAVDGFHSSGTKRDPATLLWVGSRAEHKGIEVLLRAVAIVRASRPDVRLRLIGRPRLAEEDDRWRALAGELGIGTAVTFEPWSPRPAVADAMRRATVLVHPSPAETFGVAAAEAIVAGLPVATRRSGGVPWIVETSGGFGAVARGDDPVAFAAAIESLLAGPPSIPPDAARERIVTVFGAHAVAAAALQLYPPVDAARRPSPSPATVPVLLPTIVVGIERAPTLRTVAVLPDGLRRRLTVVTARDDAPAPELGVASLVEADLDAVHRSARATHVADQARGGLVRLVAERLRGRSAAAAGAEIAAQRSEHRQAALAAALREVVQGARAEAPALGAVPVQVVAVDLGGAAAVLDNGDVATLAPAALRWLADRWDGADPADAGAPPS